MLVVRQPRPDDSPDAGASLPSLQPMGRPAEDALERGGEMKGMQSRQMTASANL